MNAYSPQLVNVVESIVLMRMQACESFTALDISNAVKTDRYPFRHREVAEVVRELYDCGAMRAYGYDRQLISVMTDNGTTPAQSWLYFHSTADPYAYANRYQEALPPVPSHQARDVSDTVAAAPLGLLARYARPSTSRTRKLRSPQGRRDGALPIPRRLIAQLGWNRGDTLYLKAEPGKLVVDTDSQNAAEALHVWCEQRVRVCKSKLRLGALTADVVRLEITGNCLEIVTAKNR